MDAVNLHTKGSGRPFLWLLGIVLASITGGAQAYDLTPDRGPLATSLSNGAAGPSGGYFTWYVYNVGSNDWGPVNNCGTNWANAQWRSESGKRLGAVVSKPVAYQTDFNPITNGWFTPNPQRPYAGCGGSHISRGWDDEYGNSMPSSSSISHSTKPTFHVKLDPARLNADDENLDNNEVWLTTQWSSTQNSFVPVETIDLQAGTTTLVASDSLFYGAYSTNTSLGKITITNKARTTNLTTGNQKVGYQGRQMQVSVAGATANVYTIKNGSKVRADFLGQNGY